MLNHAMNNETAKIIVALYWAGVVNHTIMKKTIKITGIIFVWHVQWTPSTIQIKTC